MANLSNSSVGIKIARNDPIIVYLMFVDNCLMFCMKKTGKRLSSQGYFCNFTAKLQVRGQFS